jgi:hypothetical protein
MVTCRPVVPKHELNAPGETPIEELPTRKISHEDSVNGWTVLKLAVKRLSYFDIVGLLENQGALVSKTS